MILDFDDQLTADSGTAGSVTSSVQDFTGTAGAAIAGNRIKDAGLARDWGTGELLIPYLRCTVAGAGASSGFQVDIVGADNAALSSNAVVLSTRTIATSALTANSLHYLPPLGVGSSKRYLGVKVTPTGSNSTAGSFIIGFHAKDAAPQNVVTKIL